MRRLTKRRHVLRDMSKESFKRDVQEFDPEDPKVWEQADQELTQAAAQRDVLGNYPILERVCKVIVWSIWPILAGIALGLAVRFLK